MELDADYYAAACKRIEQAPHSKGCSHENPTTKMLAGCAYLRWLALCGGSMSLHREFKIQNETVLKIASNFLESNWKPLLDAGNPIIFDCYNR